MILSLKKGSDIYIFFCVFSPVSAPFLWSTQEIRYGASLQPHQPWSRVARRWGGELCSGWVCSERLLSVKQGERGVHLSQRCLREAWHSDMGVAWKSAEHGEDPQVSANTWMSQEQRTRPNPPKQQVWTLFLLYISVLPSIPSDALNFPDAPQRVWR